MRVVHGPSPGGGPWTEGQCYVYTQKFISRIFGWNNTFTYNTKNKAFWSKLVIFDTMPYQRLPEYQISFPLFRVSEP